MTARGSGTFAASTPEEVWPAACGLDHLARWWLPVDRFEVSDEAAVPRALSRLGGFIVRRAARGRLDAALDQLAWICG